MENLKNNDFTIDLEALLENLQNVQSLLSDSLKEEDSIESYQLALAASKIINFMVLQITPER